ncbi:medium-chain acyl-CoA ligase ACSF2, mitochondrial-like [Rhagoletis pomonella]|uniref:medium-chain acyl-CoA ligase ACSF2, mitochondrial-like n=1 Tax=Rhagoletis pomonella TaxID=28610 RepID=UPI0017810A1D|nr:medium-chain acyl-CoA ligase ACSF2, mitochondrial-like [Rhagoletis pomonella]
MQIRLTLLRAIGHCKQVNAQLNAVRSASYQCQLNNRRCYSDRAYFHQVGNEPLLYRTLGQQVQISASKYGERPALISRHENKRYTFAEIKNEAENLAVKLNELGMQRGDHLGLWITNNSQWYITYLAAALAGYTVACINPALQAQEIAYALKKARVKTLVTKANCGLQDFCGILKELLPSASLNGRGPIDDPKFPYLRHVVVQSDAPLSEFLSWEELSRSKADLQDISALNKNVELIAPESGCNIQFTSGTTGVPKVALLSHFSYLNQGHQFGFFYELHKSHKTICLTLPFFHIFGLSVVMSALSHGATLVLPSPRFDSVAALESVAAEGCNMIFGTPTMYVDLLEKQRELNKPIHTLETGIVGGAACTPEIYTQTKKMFALKNFYIGYGMSENSAASFMQDGTESEEEAAQTVGRLLQHAEAKVIDDKGETVRFGEVGELCVRGYFVMTEYYDDVEKTKEVLDKHGWLKTGDTFILEPNGVGRILGRKKDVIIRGGENVFPKEIEDYLDTHVDIIEAQVIGIPDKRMGEEICAYLRLRSGAKELTVDEVKNFCKGKIAHFKVPRYVRFVDEYPKTTSGKIQKFELLNMFNKELKSSEN